MWWRPPSSRRRRAGRNEDAPWLHLLSGGSGSVRSSPAWRWAGGLSGRETICGCPKPRWRHWRQSRLCSSRVRVARRATGYCVKKPICSTRHRSFSRRNGTMGSGHCREVRSSSRARSLAASNPNLRSQTRTLPPTALRRPRCRRSFPMFWLKATKLLLLEWDRLTYKNRHYPFAQDI